MLSLEEAQQAVLATIPAPESETVPLDRAAGRIIAAPAAARHDLPPFDNSAMDGYAVRAADVAPAGADQPVPLKLVGRVVAGEEATAPVVAGACVRVFTGSPLPAGADAVVMQEDTRADPADSSRVLILDAVKPWENCRFQGEDVKRDAVVASPGERVTSGRLALLGAAGVDLVNVARQPVVGLLATGSELLEAGQPLAPGKIHESNRLMLASLITAAGALPKIYPLVPDTLEETRDALHKALAECDAVVTSGGVSVGEHDFVKAAFAGLGGTLDLWRVSIKPGKPFAFGRHGNSFLFGLPGNPVSALVTFTLLVRPALLRMQGSAGPALRSHPGVLAEPLDNRAARRHFARVTVAADGMVRSTGAQASHVLGSLAPADGLVDVPPGTTLGAGTMVPVIRWD